MARWRKDQSDYAEFSFYLLALIMAGVGLCLFCCTGCALGRATPTPVAARVVAALCAAMAVIALLLLAGAEGFSLLPLAASVVLSAVIIAAPFGVFIGLLLSDGFAAAFRRPRRAKGKGNDAGEDADADGSATDEDSGRDGVPLRPQSEPVSGVPGAEIAGATTVNFSVTSESADAHAVGGGATVGIQPPAAAGGGSAAVDAVASPAGFSSASSLGAAALPPAVRLAALKKSLVPYGVAVVVALLLVSLIAHMSLSAGCYEVSPVKYSSWASRRDLRRFCAPGAVCHEYALVGPHCSAVTVVAHAVFVDDDDPPTAAAAEVVVRLPNGAGGEVDGDVHVAHAYEDTTERPVPVPATDTSGLPPRSASQPLPGRISSHHTLREDRRAVAFFPLLNLPCNARVEIRATTFRLRSGTMLRRGDGAEAPVYRTLPSQDAGRPRADPLPNLTATAGVTAAPSTTLSVALSTADDPAETIRFVSGGDLWMTEIGFKWLRRGLDATNGTARFLYIGGDVNYANNVRRCYRRWDEFFNVVASLRRRAPSTGATTTTLPTERLLLLTAVGNHEAGGYRHDAKVGRYGDEAGTMAARRDAYVDYARYLPSADAVFDYAFFPPPGGADAAAGAALRSNPALAWLFANATTATPAAFSSSATWRYDPTVTFSRHYIGRSAWMILDSGAMVATAAQAPLVAETLAHWAALRAAGHLDAVVVSYHDPMLPSSKALENEHALDLQRDFLPLFQRFRVPLVLENHVHSFKRSVPIAAVPGAGLRAAAAGEPGIVFLGDGALGTAEGYGVKRATNGKGLLALRGDHWTMARVADADNVQAGVLWPHNRSATVRVLIAKGATRYDDEWLTVV